MSRSDAPSDAEVRGALVSLLLMLAFVGAGLGLAGFGLYLILQGPPPGERAPRTTPRVGQPMPPQNEPAQRAAQPTPDQSAEIDRLIGELGDRSYRVRTAASERLRALGEMARSALEQARESRDAEVRDRARRLLEMLDQERR